MGSVIKCRSNMEELSWFGKLSSHIINWAISFLFSRPQLVLILLFLPIVTQTFWKILRKSSSELSFSAGSIFLLILLLLTTIILEQETQTRLRVLREKLRNAEKDLKMRGNERTEMLEKFHENLTTTAIHNDCEDSLKIPENPLDDCLHVFIDLGSNRGIQIRKLYESHLFPLAPVLPLYERYFGKPEDRNLQEICSVSFEPNKKHMKTLKELSEAYSTCGIKMIVYNAGVGDKDTKAAFAHFNTFYGLEVGNEVTARILDEKSTRRNYEDDHAKSTIDEVDIMRFSKFLNEVVKTRKLPLSAEVTDPKVVVKSDIEGSELQLVLDMITTGAFNHIDNLHMEWHGLIFFRQDNEAKMISKLAPAIQQIADLSGRTSLKRGFDLEELDDETYSGMGEYKPWGDFSDKPPLTC